MDGGDEGVEKFVVALGLGIVRVEGCVGECGERSVGTIEREFEGIGKGRGICFGENQGNRRALFNEFGVCEIPRCGVGAVERNGDR